MERSDTCSSSVTQPVAKKIKRVYKRRKTNPSLEFYNKKEVDYYKQLTVEKKGVIVDLESQIVNINSTNVPNRFRILESNSDDKIKAIAIQKINQLARIDCNSSDFNKISQWIETMVNIPFGKFISLPVKETHDSIVKASFLKKIKENLDKEVYGHIDAKQHMVRIMAQWVNNSDSKGISIGIHGPMGCGKTSFVKSLCKSLNIPHGIIALGGISDASFLEGHGYTYEGSKHGKIVDTLIKCKCMNPIIFFDELDKISDTPKGWEIMNILIHLTDPIQNHAYVDRYFAELDIDLSRCIFIFSYNDKEKISPILKDRLITIETPGYKHSDKLTICTQYMIPSILSDFKMDKDDVVFSNEIVIEIINYIEEEKGVRNLKRGIVDIISNINLNILMENSIKIPYKVTSKDVNKYVYAKKNTCLQNGMYL